MEKIQTPFEKNQYGKEVLKNSFCNKSSSDLIIELIAIAAIFGVNRVESAIRETYTRESSNKIIGMMNLATNILSK